MAPEATATSESLAAESQQKDVVRVTYWAGRGRTERIRCLLAAANIKFESSFLHGPEDLKALRNAGKLDYGQVPLVEMDGLNLVQTMPTLIYIAEKYNFLPTNIKDKQEALSIVFAAEDSRMPLLGYPFFGCDKDKCIEGLKASKGLFDRYLPKWEEKLIKNKKELNDNNDSTTTTTSFFIGTTPTVADIAVFEVFDFFVHIFGDNEFRIQFKSFPNLLSLYDNVLDVGRMKVWCHEERPKLYLDWPDYSQIVLSTLEAKTPF